MINSGHSYFLFGLNNRNNRLSSKGIYAKNKFKVHKLKILVSKSETINKIKK